MQKTVEKIIKHGLTEADIAYHCKSNTSSVHKWLKGKTIPRRVFQSKLNDLLRTLDNRVIKSSILAKGRVQ